MPDQPSGNPPVTTEVEASLHAIARVLREAPPLGPQAQRALAALVDELGNALHSAEVPAAEVRHLADSTATLVSALQHRHDVSRLARARDRLEEAILGIEGKAPVTAGLARRVLDALANIGI